MFENLNTLRKIQMYKSKISTPEEALQLERQELKVRYAKQCKFFETSYAIWKDLFSKCPLYNSNGIVVDPCCGLSSLRDFLSVEYPRRTVVQMDINKDFVDYNNKIGKTTEWADFLIKHFDTDQVIEEVIMNPPFTLINQFLDKAVSIAPRVIAIVPTNYKFHRDVDKYSYNEYPLDPALCKLSFPVTCKGIEIYG